MTLKPGQFKTNEFEDAILDNLLRSNPNRTLNLLDLHVLSRTYTGVGCMVLFLVQKEFDEKEVDQYVLKGNIFLPSLQNGLMAVLLTKGSAPVSLEIVSFEEPWDGTFEGFSISE